MVSYANHEPPQCHLKLTHKVELTIGLGLRTRYLGLLSSSSPENRVSQQRQPSDRSANQLSPARHGRRLTLSRTYIFGYREVLYDLSSAERRVRVCITLSVHLSESGAALTPVFPNDSSFLERTIPSKSNKVCLVWNMRFELKFKPYAVPVRTSASVFGILAG